MTDLTISTARELSRLPSVSVIMPTYNRARLLPRAIRSVLAQTYTDFELIVVDDASPDETPEVAASLANPRLRYLRQPTNRGVSAARNTGVEAARGEIIVFVDDDDRVDAEFLAVMVEHLHKAPADVAFGLPWRAVVRLDATFHEQPLYIHRQGHDTGGVYPGTHLLRRPSGSSSGLVLRTAAFRQIGGFDETMRYAEDTDLLIRLAQKYDYLVVAQPLYNLSVIAGVQATHWSAMRGDNLVLLADRYADIVTPWRRRRWMIDAARNYFGCGARQEGRRVMRWLVRERPWHPAAYVWWLLFENHTRLPAGLEKRVFRPLR